MSFIHRIKQLRDTGNFSQELLSNLENFYHCYHKALIENQKSIRDYEYRLEIFLKLIIEQIQSPFIFESYHRQIRDPFDYYRFGIDFISPLVQKEKSKILGLEYVDQISNHLMSKDNVILFANHQIEPDPQAIRFMLKQTHPILAEQMIFVAGHKVTTDPLAIPFSMGCNLLCIYSKNYIDRPPEEKSRKIAHNQKTMKIMQNLLDKGGKCIYVAPGGGRDRPNRDGKIEVAEFDYQSIEMFRFIASRAKNAVHFYPLALNTYNLLPPPNQVKNTMGEARVPQCAPIKIAFGNEIIFDKILLSNDKDKKTKRKALTSHIWSLVDQLYQLIY